MATRQYIGARYVPKFVGEWDNTTAYEPLSIVLHNNASYTSKKQVPAGVLVTNTQYWVQTGSYNGFIQQIQQEVTALQEDVEELQDDIPALKLRTNEVTGRKMLFIGDSYVGYKVDNLKSFFDYAGESLGCDYTVSYYAGMGFTNINNRGKFISLLQAVPAEDRASYSDIVVASGCNDYDSVSSTKSAIQEFCQYAFANFPNAKVHIAMVGGFTDYQTSHSQIFEKALPAYRACGQYGAHYIDNAEYIMYDAASFRDGVHPVDSAIQRMGYMIAEGIINGACQIEEYKRFKPTPVNGTGYTITESYLPDSYTFIHNNRVGFGTKGYVFCSFQVTSYASCISGGTFDHEILDGFNFYGFPSNWTSGLYACPVSVKVQKTNSVEMTTGLMYAKTNGKLAVTIQGLYSSDVQSISLWPMGICDLEFDLTR